MAAKAYDLLNARLAADGIEICTPATETDVAIVLFLVTPESLSSNLFIPVSVLDKIGLLGGSESIFKLSLVNKRFLIYRSVQLFNGFSIVVMFEMAYWLLFGLLFCASKNGAKPHRGLDTLTFTYKSNSTMHGFAYLDIVGALGGKVHMDNYR